MAAKDYRLCVSPLTGTVYISKVSKRHVGLMLDDRAIVDKSEFIHQMVQWIESEMGDKNDLSITAGGKVILTISKPSEK